MNDTRGKREPERNRERGRRRSSLRENLVEETQHLGHVELDVFEVQEVLVVFLLLTRELLQ